MYGVQVRLLAPAVGLAVRSQQTSVNVPVKRWRNSLSLGARNGSPFVKVTTLKGHLNNDSWGGGGRSCLLVKVLLISPKSL